MPTPDAFLVIAGITVPASAESVEESEPVVRGALVRAADNTLRSTIDPRVKREWTVSTIPMTQGDLVALRAAAPHGVPVSVSGRMLGDDGETSPATPVLCVVDYGRARYKKAGETGIRRVPSFTVREV